MINTLTLNPAIDSIIYLDRFRPNVTNRIQKTAITMGGKGTHVSMNLSIMGSPSRAFGFGFGKNGRDILKMLEQSGVTPCFVYDEHGENRVNYLIVEYETKDSTLVTNQGPTPTVDQTEALYEMIRKTVCAGDMLALSGDASNFADPYIYNRIMDLISGRDVKVFLDASGESLKRGLEQRPFLVKPNDDELSALTGRTLKTQKDIIKAIGELEKFNIEIVVISLGENGSIVRALDQLYKIKPPKVNVFNTVGCGDCLIAGLLHGFEQGNELIETLRYATAASAAMAEEALSVNFDAQRAHELLDQVEIQRI